MKTTVHGNRGRGVGKIINRPAWEVGGFGQSGVGRTCVLSRLVSTRAREAPAVMDCLIDEPNNPYKQSNCLKTTSNGKYWSRNPECSGGVGRHYNGSSCGKLFRW
tara:strand:- start:324 stop:638 length:315 start_codon:yes stop_codon:yes gene_type:complete